MSVQKRKNRAVIIVNYEFHSRAESLSPRKGAKREADKLFKALSKLNYAVKLHYDQTAKEIEEIYQQGTRPLLCSWQCAKLRVGTSGWMGGACIIFVAVWNINCVQL